MKLFLFFALSTLIQIANAQVKVTKLDSKALPKSVNFKGKVINAIKYIDKDGEQLVITTEDRSQNENFKSADLYAYHYNLKDNKFMFTWKVHDFVADCSLDLTASFLPGTFAVTDLNKNGKAEVWLMYQTACRGDVSPIIMKIIMYEAEKKYAVRGTHKVKVSEKEFIGGEYRFDDAFATGSEIFKQYAVELWKKNLMEKWN